MRMPSVRSLCSDRSGQVGDVKCGEGDYYLLLHFTSNKKTLAVFVFAQTCGQVKAS